MSVTLADLITIQTKEEIEAAILTVAGEQGFEITAWEVGTVPRTIIKGVAAASQSLWSVVAQIARAGFRRTSTGSWLTLLALEGWDETRVAAIKTQGNFLLTDAGGGPHTVAARAHRVAVGDIVFVNTAAFVLGANAAASYVYEAEVAGVAGNIPTASTLSQLVELAGVTVTNPDPGTGTWITTSGTDEQSDASLREVLRLKWAALAVGVPGAAYEYAARVAQPSITQAVAQDDNPSGEGSVRLLLANSAGPATASEVSAVDLAVRPLIGIGVKAFEVVAAGNYVITLTGTVTCEEAKLAAAETALATAIAGLTASLTLGAVVRLSALYALISAIDGVLYVNLTAPIGDTSIGEEFVATFDNQLVFTS